MLKPELISCVIPYAGAQMYPKAREHLFEALHSARPQAFGEIVLSYDGPESDPLEGFPGADRIRVVRQPKRVGPAMARNAGIEACKNKHVVLLDQDDVLGPGYLTAMLAWVEQNQVRCGAATLYYIGKSQKRVGTIVSRHPDFFLPTGFFCEIALAREAGLFPDSASEDLYFFQSLRKIAKLATCPDARALYRIHPQASAGNMMVAWVLHKLQPKCESGQYTLAELNVIAKAYVKNGTIPAGLEDYFQGSESVTARMLARNTYACWLNRDVIGLIRYGSKAMMYLPKLRHMARYKWKQRSAC